MKEEQLLLFYEPTEQRIERKVSELDEQLNNVRKGIFHRHTALAKMVMELKEEVYFIKMNQIGKKS